MGWVCVIQNINTDSCNKHPEHEAEDPFSGGVKGGGMFCFPCNGALGLRDKVVLNVVQEGI